MIKQQNMPDKNCPHTNIQREVLEVLLKGGKITGKNIANEIGLRQRSTGKEGADLRSVINALRRQGYPICADTDGYWYAESEEDLKNYIESLEGRIAKETEALNGLKKILSSNNFKMMPKSDASFFCYTEIFKNHFTNGKYNVRKDDIDGWVCDCESFKYSGHKKICKHIKEVQAALKVKIQEEIKKYQKSLL